MDFLSISLAEVSRLVFSGVAPWAGYQFHQLSREIQDFSKRATPVLDSTKILVEELTSVLEELAPIGKVVVIGVGAAGVVVVMVFPMATFAVYQHISRVSEGIRGDQWTDKNYGSTARDIAMSCGDRIKMHGDRFRLKHGALSDSKGLNIKVIPINIANDGVESALYCLRKNDEELDAYLIQGAEFHYLTITDALYAAGRNDSGSTHYIFLLFSLRDPSIVGPIVHKPFEVPYSLSRRIRIVAADTNGAKAHSLSDKSIVEMDGGKDGIHSVRLMTKNTIVQPSKGVGIDDHRTLLELGEDGGTCLFELVRMFVFFVLGLIQRIIDPTKVTGSRPAPSKKRFIAPSV